MCPFRFVPPSARKGFTLVELSIVLVILGLLVGGVLAGQSLIRAAEIKAVTTEFEKHQTALGAFKDKYFAMPGDMPNAVAYWGAQAGTTTDGVNATCAALTTASTGIATCNGDGNGFISAAGAGSQSHELFRSWQHLANAGLVEGSFSGVAGAGSIAHTIIGTNIPRSKIGGAGWFLIGMGSYTNVAYFQANYGNTLMIGTQTLNSATDSPFLKAEEAYNVDMKLDDGKPHLGKVLALKNAYNANCVPAGNDQYSLSNTTIGCTLVMITGY